jgi:hypothetical protein
MANMTFSEALEELMKDPDDMDACMNNNELPGFPEGWTLQIYHADDPSRGKFLCLLVPPDPVDEDGCIESLYAVAFVLDNANGALRQFK